MDMMTQTSALIATAREALSPHMYDAFLSWGEAAIRANTRPLEDDEDLAERESSSASAEVRRIGTIDAQNAHDLMFKTYLMALEAADCPSTGPLRINPDLRSCERQWTRRNHSESTVHLLTMIPSLPRPLLARVTSLMIDRMDEIDGDPDIEDDDPSGGSADDTGEIEPWQGDGIAMALPKYRSDQSVGPSNVRQAELEFRRTWNATFVEPS